MLMPWWAFLVIGVFAGATFGLLLGGLLRASGGDESEIVIVVQAPVEEAAAL